ncbi:hypothetical protein BU17DRAFT_56670 [Hysterangium stoloniferum]|nr:hypothetical protein BU17DRAFT_56670 [Hysterangium stoloniferum]
MPSPYYIGGFSKPVDVSRIIHIKHPHDTETLQTGDIVERWDHVFEWDQHCIKASELEKWRMNGDPLCDAAIRAMFDSSSSSAGIDLLQRLHTNAAEDPHGPSQMFLDHVSRQPPDGVAATPEEIGTAQAFFLQHAMAIMEALLHFSLAGGFSSPRITKILQSISYLVPPNTNKKLGTTNITPEMNDRTYMRLLETMQFVLDVLGCTNPYATFNESVTCLHPGEDGWKAALRVRLLHGISRRRILEHRCSYSIEEDGIPINQEDMAATLGSFGAAPIVCLSRIYPLPMGLPTPKEASAFVATWRHIGFYLGIDATILINHFATFPISEKFLASSVVHLLTSPPETGLYFPTTIPILHAVSNRQPYPSTFVRHCALTRKLLGPSLSDHLKVPSTPFGEHIRLCMSHLTAQIPVLFAYYYPRVSWRATKAALTRASLARLVIYKLGMRRTTFRPRTDSGELRDEVKNKEAIAPDPEGRKRLVSGWKTLFCEMVGVILGSFIVILGTVLWTYVQLSN